MIQIKKTAGVIAGFIAGVIMTSGVTMAATSVIKAHKGSATIDVNGKKVTSSTDLTYGKSTYLSLSSVEKALKQAGLGYTWSGHTLKLTTPKSSITPSKNGTVVQVSKLPYTFTAKDGLRIKFNSIKATSKSTVFNITESNIGKETDADPSSPMNIDSISDGGPQVNFVSESDVFYNADLEPGESVTGNVTFGHLKSGVKEFTLYFYDFDFNKDHIVFQLHK